jgi:hypothetical protein
MVKRKIILCIVATILSFLVFDILFDIGFIGSTIFGEKVPFLAYIFVVVIIGIFSLGLWIWTLRKIIKTDWQAKNKKIKSS